MSENSAAVVTTNDFRRFFATVRCHDGAFRRAWLGIKEEWSNFLAPREGHIVALIPHEGKWKYGYVNFTSGLTFEGGTFTLA